MAAIDVGFAAADYDAASALSNTVLTDINPANDTGTLTSVELWCDTDGANVKIGTFSGSSNDWTMRDYATIGSVTSGSKQTFSGLSIDVVTADIIGIYGTGGQIDTRDAAGVGSKKRGSGDYFDGSVHTYSDVSTQDLAIYGTGATAAAGWTGKINGVTNPAKIMGIAVANIAKVNGI